MKTLEQYEQALIELEEISFKSPEEAIQRAIVVQKAFSSFVQSNKGLALELARAQSKAGMILAPETNLRLLLEYSPADIEVLHLLSTLASRSGHHDNAVTFLLECLKVNSSVPVFHYDLANALTQAGNHFAALKECNYILAQLPSHFETIGLKASLLVKLGQFNQAEKIYSQLSKDYPAHAQILLRHGVVLRIIGESDKAISAFQNALKLAPDLCEAYWNLANLKTYSFSESTIRDMQDLLASDELSPENSALLNFALGKANEDGENYSEAFGNYKKANKVFRDKSNYDARQTTEKINLQKKVFTSSFFSNRSLQSFSEITPIFIVGLPRSGSTLLEQILSSHSQVEATMELTEISSMVRSLSNLEFNSERIIYPEIVTRFSDEELKAFGQEYLKRTEVYRTDKKYFIDKTPHNFIHIGLILSILPNAKIIDARREPLSCGFSVFKQHFASGHNFSNSLSDIGHYYKDYLDLIRHWKSVQPQKILTVNYESVVTDFENQVRNILKFCDLDFEADCLNFYNSKRAVATVSSEQVRQPIYSTALDQWKNFETYLTPLKEALKS